MPSLRPTLWGVAGRLGPRLRLLVAVAVIAAVVIGLVVVRHRAAAGSGWSPDFTISADAPDMVAAKQAAGMADCPAAEATDGPLPDVTLPCLGGGRDVNLSTLRGPYVIVVFQAACRWCSKELPALAEYNASHGSRVGLLGIDMVDTHPGVALQEAASYGVRFPIVADFDGDIQGTALSVPGVPMTFLVSASGAITKVRGFPYGAAEFARFADQALAKS